MTTFIDDGEAGRLGQGEEPMVGFVAALARELRALRTSDDSGDLLHDPSSTDEMRFSGAKGAVAWEKEAKRHRAEGGGLRELREVYEAGRRKCSAEEPGSVRAGEVPVQPPRVGLR